MKHKTFFLFSILLVPFSTVCATSVYKQNQQENSLSNNSSFSFRKVESINLPTLFSKPDLRKSEFVEVVPGVFTAQQYGPGTAGNIYLRGRFLQYGAGLLTNLDGMPISMRGNAIANGYTDLNIIIPELIDRVDYQKGPYSIDQGSLSSAGTVGYTTVNALDKSLLQLAIGQDFFFRMIAATSEDWMGGKFLYAADIGGFDNAWGTPDEDEERLTSYFKQSWEVGDEAYGFSFYGMRNNWNSPTPIPDRVVASGSINELDSLTTNDRGKSRLAGVNGYWQETSHLNSKFINAYFYSSEIELYTNNTYALYDNVLGDQFLQIDLRNVLGLNAEYSTQTRLNDLALNSSVGIQFQNDAIRNAGLFHTKNNEVVNRITQDEIVVRSVGVYVNNDLLLTQQLMAGLDLRYDFYNFDTVSSTIGNTNSDSDSHPRENLRFNYSFSDNFSSFAKIGKSYDTNQVQEINNTIDPLSGASVKRKLPFIDTMQTELGAKYRMGGLQFAITAWKRESDAEIVYIPTTNTTTSTRSSKRKGIDVSVNYDYNRYIVLDTSVTLSDAKYDDIDYSVTSAGDNIVGAPDLVAGFNVRYIPKSGYFAVLDSKYIGKRPLNESGTVVTGPVPLTNLRIGRRWKDFSMHMDFLNLLNSDAKEVNYIYSSQLSSESASVEDTHYRVLSPFTYRIFITHDFK